MEENNKELNNKILGEIIRNYRKRKGLSLENLAKQMDITKLSIQKYEVGKRTIPFNTLLDFFRILEIPLNELEKFFKRALKFKNEEIEDVKNGEFKKEWTKAEKKEEIKEIRRQAKRLKAEYEKILKTDYKPEVKIYPKFLYDCFLIDCPRHQKLDQEGK